MVKRGRSVLAGLLLFFSGPAVAEGWSVTGGHVTQVVAKGAAIYVGFVAPPGNPDNCTLPPSRWSSRRSDGVKWL